MTRIRIPNARNAQMMRTRPIRPMRRNGADGAGSPSVSPTETGFIVHRMGDLPNWGFIPNPTGFTVTHGEDVGDVTIITPSTDGFIVNSMTSLPEWALTPTNTGFIVSEA